MLVFVLQLLGTAYELPVEAPIVTDARALEEPGRYDVPKSFDETVEFYKRVFKHTSSQIRWRNIVNSPGIKAKHIQSLRNSTQWEGINIYEKAGKVRIFVIARPAPPPSAKKSTKTKK
jgi:hypothetical protein